MVKVYNVSSVDFSKVVFSKPIKGSDGKYFVASQVRDDDESPSYELMIQFGTKVSLTNGLGDQENSKVHTSTDLRLASEQYIEFIKEADDHMLSMCKLYKLDWFPNQDLTDSYLENAFMPSMKSIKKSSEHLLKVRPSGQLQVYNSERDSLDPLELDKTSKISTILALSGLWFTKTRFGITWKLQQVKVAVPKRPVKEYLFDDATEYDEELDNVWPDDS